MENRIVPLFCIDSSASLLYERSWTRKIRARATIIPANKIKFVQWISKNKKLKHTHLVMPFKFNEQYREYISVMISSTTIIQQRTNDMFDKNSNSFFDETNRWKEAEDVMESRPTLEFRGNLSLNEHVMRRFRYRSFSSLFWFSSQRKKKETCQRSVEIRVRKRSLWSNLAKNFTKQWYTFRALKVFLNVIVPKERKRFVFAKF